MKPMCISIYRDGVRVLYRCYKLPGYGRKCPYKDTNRCFTCRYSKAEMTGEDATKLLKMAKRGES